MARVIEDLSKESKSKYPFDEWADGQTWEIVQGEDFDCSVKGMISSLHYHAKKQNRKLQTRENGSSICFKFFDAPYRVPKKR